MSSQPGSKIVKITHCVISISKNNQAVKFSQLIKSNVRNIVLQISCGKCDRETSSRPLFVFQKDLI